MNIIALLFLSITCMSTLTILPSSDNNIITITAYKIAPKTHAETWTITTAVRPKPSSRTYNLNYKINAPTLSNASLQASAPVKISKTKLTYITVYIPSRAPVKTVIKPEKVHAAGEDPVIIINEDGTAHI